MQVMILDIDLLNPFCRLSTVYLGKLIIMTAYSVCIMCKVLFPSIHPSILSFAGLWKAADKGIIGQQGSQHQLNSIYI